MKRLMTTALLCAGAIVAASAAAQATPAPGKTRAEVIADMRAAREAGTLYALDYYPVFDRAWPTSRAKNTGDGQPAAKRDNAISDQKQPGSR